MKRFCRKCRKERTAIPDGYISNGKNDQRLTYRGETGKKWRSVHQCDLHVPKYVNKNPVQKKMYRCKTCNKPFLKYPNAQQKYCNKKCYQKKFKKERGSKVLKCKICSTEYCYIGTGGVIKYCSDSCRETGKKICRQNEKRHLKPEATKNCLYCDKEFKTKYEKKKCCSETCSRKRYYKSDEAKASRKKWRDNNRDIIREQRRLRKRAERRAKPSWCSWKKIAEFTKTRPSKKHDLDHIIPLNHPEVCGLHCIENFQWLTKDENNEKSNQFDGTTENKSWNS